jgi:hypothetical protein
MIMDERTEFCDAVSVAAVAGTALVGSQIDMSVARDLGNGQPVYLVIISSSSWLRTARQPSIRLALRRITGSRRSS